MITMPLPQLPLSQLPSQNPQRPVTSGHAIRAVSTHSSTRPFAPLSAHCSASLLCSRKVWVTHSGGSLSQTNSTTPPFPEKVLDCFHSAYSCFHLGVAVHPVNNRFAVPFDLQRRQLLGYRYSEFRVRQISGLLCRQDPVGLLCLFHRLFHGLEQATDNVFLTRIFLRHKLDPVLPLAGPPRHRCPLYSSVMEANLVLPPLNITRIPRHTAGGRVSPPRSCSPFQNGTKSQHNWDITIIRKFLGQQRQALFFPTGPHGP